MANNDLHNLDIKELQTRLEEVKSTYFNWKEAIMTGKESNYARLKELRREIARVNTVCQEKERVNRE